MSWDHITPKQRSDLGRLAAKARWRKFYAKQHRDWSELTIPKQKPGEATVNTPKPQADNRFEHLKTIVGILRQYNEEDRKGLMNDAYMVVEVVGVTEEKPKTKNGHQEPKVQRIPPRGKIRHKKMQGPTERWLRNDGMTVSEKKYFLTQGQRKILNRNVSLAIESKFKTPTALIEAFNLRAKHRVSVSWIWSLLSGRHDSVKIVNLDRLAETLHMTVDELVTRDLMTEAKADNQEAPDLTLGQGN